MPRNIEIKAHIDNVHALLPQVAAWASEGPTILHQDDTFFPCTAGRLKLRAFPDGNGVLIYYRRADAAGPKESFYQLAPVEGADALRKTLGLAYGLAGRVRKHRTLFTIGRTRVHLDRVEGLGDFLELEVLLEDDETSAQGEEEAQDIMDKLGVQQSSLIACAYVDLLERKASETTGADHTMPSSTARA